MCIRDRLSALNTGYPKSLEIKDFPEPIPPIIPTLIMFNFKSHSFIFLEIQLILCLFLVQHYAKY